MPSQLEHLNRLTRDLYDGILSSDSWQKALGELGAMTRSEHGSLLTWDQASDLVLAAERYGVYPARIDDAYSCSAFEDAARLCIDNRVVGNWYLGNPGVNQAGRGTAESADRFHSFMHHHGLRSLMCAPLMREGNICSGLSFEAGPHRPPYGEQEIKAIAPLMPHLITAVALRWRMQHLSRLALLGEQLLDHLQSPILVVDANARILFANSTGQHWLSHGHHPFSYQSTLKQARPWPDLMQFAARICGADPVPVATMKLDPVHGETPIYLVGLPFRMDHPLAQGWLHPVGIVIVHDPSLCRVPCPRLMQQLFALTPAEARLVEQLAEYHSLSDAAETLGVSRETVRSQLKSIFKKTGSRNQNALVQLIAGLSQVH